MEQNEKELNNKTTNKNLEETLYIESISGLKEELIKRGNAGEDEFVSEDEVDF